MRLATAILLFALNITSILGSNVPHHRDVRTVEGVLETDNSAPVVQDNKRIAEIDISGDVNKNVRVEVQPVVTKTKIVINDTNTSPNSTSVLNKNPFMPGLDEKLQSGALLRGFFVLLGATILLLVYLGIRMFRLSKGHKSPAMVRKYGVLTNRTDVEMLPLPLSEDDDDDTVFEINNHVNR